MNQKTFFLLILSVFIVNICSAQSFENKIDSLLSDYNNKPGCAIAIFEKGNIIFKKGYGYANLDHKVKITPNTVFDIASVAKQFTASCIILLEEQKKIKIEDSIRKYLPELPKYKKGEIKIYDLLHHTSGLKDYSYYIAPLGKTDYDIISEEDGFNILTGLRELNFVPRSKYQYSNSNYLALAVIIRRITGMSIGEFANKNIFHPLAMNNSLIYEDRNQVIENRAIGYSSRNKTYIQNHSFNFAMGGDGQLYTSVEDFFKWHENYKKQIIGGKNFTKKMTEKGILKNGDIIDYALGLKIREFRGLNSVSHLGSWAGSLSHYLSFPDEDFAVVILSNNSDFEIVPRPYQIAEIYLEDKMQPVPPSPQKSSSHKKQMNKTEQPKNYSNKELEVFAGEYFNKDLNVTYEIILKDNKLSVFINGLKYTSLKPNIKKNSFSSDFGEFDFNKINGNLGFVYRDLIFKKVR
ncbi:serine hydrolase domain-containing protein [Tenacibaculum jejuense]|uniref:Putative Penicillin-binding protein n=1 Tax=Tenacibaculum jejuense TaxID=584609 RepID=A0A238U6D2_9FLAO|nr:serine hydrolase domain-containing protein [Tenacibaculum jejuense]SNR14707.1 putative Penicillin-binding protein [Tenacibaculum jejuense]